MATVVAQTLSAARYSPGAGNYSHRFRFELRLGGVKEPLVSMPAPCMRSAIIQRTGHNRTFTIRNCGSMTWAQGIPLAAAIAGSLPRPLLGGRA